MIITLKFLWVRAMALWPFILIRSCADRQDAVLLNHERIHHRQQVELLLIGFYVAYLLHYSWNRVVKKAVPRGSVPKYHF